MQNFLGPASWILSRVRIPATPRPRRRKARPTLEFLERREVLSTFTWTGNAGDGSWDTAGNWAANQAPTSGSADIIFPNAATPQTITLPAEHCPLHITSFTVQGGSYTLQGPSANSLQTLTLADGATIDTQTSGSILAIAPGRNTTDANSLPLYFLGSVTKNGPGTLALNNDVYFYATPLPTVQTLHVSAGNVNLGANANLWRSSFQIDNGSNVLVADGYKPSLGSLSGGGTLQIGVSSNPATTGVFLNTPQGVSDQFSGVINGNGGLISMSGLGSVTVGSINPAGTGTFDLIVGSGTILVSNTLRVRQLNVFTSPDQSVAFGGPASMSVSDVATFNNVSTFFVALNGTGAGQYTQLVDTKPGGNPVDLGGSTLSVSLGYAPTAGDTFTIISAPGGITGQFANIADGQILTVNNVNFRYNQTTTIAKLTAVQATATTLASSLNPSSIGQSVTFTATVAAGASPSPPATSPSMRATPRWARRTWTGRAGHRRDLRAPLGNSSITATYNATTNYFASTSTALTQTVNPWTTATTLASSLNPSVVGQSVTFTATVAAGSSAVTTGNVTFYRNGSALGTANLDGTGQATFATSALPLGNSSVTAAYNAITNYLGSTSTILTQTVGNFATSTTWRVRSTRAWWARA